jgi:hypothetical protein
VGVPHPLGKRRPAALPWPVDQHYRRLGQRLLEQRRGEPWIRGGSVLRPNDSRRGGHTQPMMAANCNVSERPDERVGTERRRA